MSDMHFSRRTVLGAAGAYALGRVAASAAEQSAQTAGGTILDFERDLFAARNRKYRHPEIDIIGKGFRPIGGNVADFAVAEHAGRTHFFYIERRLAEGTPFYPGHEIFFGHASTGDFFEWEVHDPVMLVRPGTWEGSHMWAPCVIRHGNEFIMAYTGINRHISQNIGLASSTDLFEWKRWESNPLSPCKGKAWAAWSEDRISSCRDPNLFEHAGRWWMNFTANTKEGASCIALASTQDFKQWEDHGPICVGPAGGYEMRLEGGHPQGSLESANVVRRRNKWYMLVKAKVRESKQSNWIIESDTNKHFDFAARREFWPQALGIEIIRTRGDRDLIATFSGGHIHFGVVDWSDAAPTASNIKTAEELKEWK